MLSDHYDFQVGVFLAGMVGSMIERMPTKSESPIETGMLYGFVAFWAIDRRLQIDGLKTAPLETEWTARVYQQHQVGKYRVDFAVHVTCSSGGRNLSRWIAVECDGHEFHERTREQAARDKARDRQLAADGFQVLRFTGSEIYADAPACALQVMKVAAKIVDDWMGLPA